MADKKVIVIGGTGGREHALAWKLSQSPKVGKIYIAPGNGGTGEVGENVNIQPKEVDKLVDFCKKQDIDLVVIGPDDLLASGLADTFKKAGFATFGASKKAARIESSKAFAKDLMKKQGIPTATYRTFNNSEEAISYAENQNYPLVVKASGLALGKGVIICRTFNEAKKAINEMMVDKVFNDAGTTIVIEEFMEGSEVSFHALSDGTTYALFPPSQDHKQVYDNDEGPNTGGMGAFAPVAWVSSDLTKTVEEKIIKPALGGLDIMDSGFSGCLYPGLMITGEGPKVVEYNARFGDPETEVYLRLLDSDLFDLLYACATGVLRPETVKWKPGFAVTVVLASGGYPQAYQKGFEITGVKQAQQIDNIELFHAGTKLENDKLLTAGGRVMNVTAYDDTMEQALKKAYSAVEKIHFEGMHYRKDIGKRETPKVIG